MRRANRGQRPSGRLSLHTTHIAARAEAAPIVGSQMPSQTTGLEMLSAQQPPANHGGPADARAERHHHDILEADRKSGVPFPQQGGSGVVLELERETRS